MPRFCTLVSLTALGLVPLEAAAASHPLAGSLPEHVIFRTGQTVTSGLGGLSAMDARCQDKARDAGLGGTWLAILSDSGTSARDRLAAAGADGPYFNTYVPGPQQVATDLDDLFDGQIDATLLFDEVGNSVRTASSSWTATLADGTYAGSSFDDWTSYTGSARVGRQLSTGGQWLDWFEQSGVHSAGLYCVRSDAEPSLTVPPPLEYSHTIFVTSAVFDGNFGGLAGADQECQDLAAAAGMGDRPWKAILSDSLTHARDRVAAEGPVFNTRGELVAEDHEDLFDGGNAAFVRFDENGNLLQDQVVFTGSHPDGTRYSPAGEVAYKLNWTSSTGTVVVGETTEMEAKWLERSLWLASGTRYPARLYCIDHQASCFPGALISGDNFGAAVSQCDFNGDGFDDLAVGVPVEGLETPGSSPILAAGAVNVLYGSAAGAQTAAPEDQFWHQDAGLSDHAETEDFFGAALASGDFDGDGFCDLAVGAPLESIHGVCFTGAVNVLYGSAGGLRGSPTDQLWHRSAGLSGAPREGDAFGWALAAGDFDNDGFDDLAVGVPGEDVGSAADAGAVHVVYGSAAGLQTISPPEKVWHQDVGTVEGVAQAGDRFGESLAAGDFDGDGFDDLAIGVPDENIAGETILDTGMVNVLYGSSAGLQDTAPANQFWHQDVAGLDADDGAQDDDRFGAALAAGDFDGDGFDDLAIGIPDEDLVNETVADAGAALVLHGSSGGLQANAPDEQFWHQDAGSVIGAAQPGDRFGASLAAGDFDGDGFDDVAFGVPDENLVNEAILNTGMVNVLYGSSAGLQDTSPANQDWHQLITGVEGVSENFDSFGFALAAGDLNGDGFADLAIGVPNEDVGSIVDAGAVNVLYGSSGGLDVDAVLPDQILDQDHPPEVEDQSE